jgi:polysaccharide export outer membrane protein
MAVGLTCWAAPIQDSPAKGSAESLPKSERQLKPADATGTSEPARNRPLDVPTEAAAASPVAVVDRGVSDDYQIGAGDVLHIVVWHESDATVPSVVVRPDGKISMPLLKEVSVLGLTPSQLGDKITQELTKFLTAPDVTVIVTTVNSKKIYLVGAVKRPGPLPYNYRMSVLQALTEAGGLTEFAKHKKIYVLRAENGRERKLPFDYDAVLRGEHMELNVVLVAGDTIVVPE